VGSRPGRGSAVSVADYPTGQNPEYLAVADLDGDGKPDVVTSNHADDTVSVLLEVCQP
jgi:hypothetical protein